MKSMMFILVAMLSFSILGTSAQEKNEKKKDEKKSVPKEMTLTGEVIDVKCYLTGMMGGKGEDHKQCALDCIKGGLPVGILEEKTESVYVVVPKGGMKGANEELAPFIAQKVKLIGIMVNKGGERFFLYTKMEGVK